jgi:hypothetical protein
MVFGSDIARLMAHRRADMAFLDPPYNVRIGGVVGRGKALRLQQLGRPPKEYRWKPGQSGNPKGARPKPRSIVMSFSLPTTPHRLVEK